MAEARMRMRKSGAFVVNPIAINSVNPCALALADTEGIDNSKLFGVTSTVMLVYNSSTVKLSSVSLLSVCIGIARREIDDYLVSNAMGTHNTMLSDICRSILGEHDLDPVWCAWILVVYLSSNPRGRDILKTTGLTDVDVQSAIAFERYGGEEIRRRARQKKDRRGKGYASYALYDSSDMRYKRNSRGTNSSGCSDSRCLLEFWHHALKSEDVSVLHTLAAHNKRTVRDAALCTLARQAEGTDVAGNTILQKVSLNNAVKSAQALVTFVGRRICDIPGLLILRARADYDGEYRMACGTQRINNEAASSAIHACVLPPASLRPPRSVGLAIAWSMAAKKLMPRNEESATLPVVFERYYEMMRISRHENHRNGKRWAEITRLKAFAEEESDDAVPTHVTGTTRSFLSIVTYMFMNDTHESSAQCMVNELTEMHKRVSETGIPSVEKFPSLVSISRDDASRIEPICTPSSPLSVGICANEALRRWMAGKTRKNDPCIKHLGFSCASELSRDVPGIMSTEPLPLITITDFDMERVAGERVVSPRIKSVKTAIGLHVCGDGVVRVIEILEAMKKSQVTSVDFILQARAALLVASSQASFIGNVAGHLTAGYSNAAVASSKKISVRSFSKQPHADQTSDVYSFPLPWSLQVPDVNKLFLLSVQDCYVSGLNNIQRSFDGTFYSGTYGCRVDTGYTMPGLLAHNLRSDKRQHGARFAHIGAQGASCALLTTHLSRTLGNCTLSEEAADELTVAFAKSHWITFSKPEIPGKRTVEASSSPSKRTKYYSAVPTAVRGIPHNYIPGIHTLLNDYCSFIETSRDISGRSDCDTVDSIMVLPFSGFTQARRCNTPRSRATAALSHCCFFCAQALRPNVEPTADASLRTCFREELETSVASGRAYLVDSTPEEQAIVKEPLFRRPCQVSSGDCPFSTAYENIDTFFNCCNHIALIADQACAHASATPTEKISALHSLITEFVNEKNNEPKGALAWAADALLLINTLYPKSTIVGESPYFRAFSLAVPFCHKKLKSGKTGDMLLSRVPGLKDCELSDARKFWSGFCRSELNRCAWTWGVAPFLTLILTHKGSHKTTQEVISQFKQCLENAVRASWLVYSPDGVCRPPDSYPASEAPTPMHVGRHHVDPVFVGDEEHDVVQRGALVGVKPHTYRQLLASMMGACIDGVECNAYINEGGLALRVSSDATIVNEEGEDRTNKSISPVQTEGDEAAYGSRKNKINGAVMQKSGWDRNALLGKPLYTAIEAPLDADTRSRGEFGFSQFFQAKESIRLQEQHIQSSDYAHAKACMHEAADVRVAKAVNSALNF